MGDAPESAHAMDRPPRTPGTSAQESLWSLGVSGDLPVLLVRVARADDTPPVLELLRVHTYWESLGVEIDLVILDEEPGAPRPRLRQHIVSYTLDQLGSMLNPEAFMRVHRSAIVQFGHIRELVPWFSGRYKLVLTGVHEVIASRERSKTVKERLKI